MYCIVHTRYQKYILSVVRERECVYCVSPILIIHYLIDTYIYYVGHCPTTYSPKKKKNLSIDD